MTARYGYSWIRTLSLLLLCTFTLALPLAGCSDEPAPAGDDSPATAEPAAEPAAQEPAPAAAGDLAPATSRDSGAALGEETISSAGALFTLPADWRSETPSSSMRAAQASVPGDAGAGTFTLFHFGPGGGGGVESNLERWIGQMEMAEGTQPRRESFEVGAFRVTWIEVPGTLKGGTMGGPAEAQPDYTLLGAVVEGGQGPWYFKITGPTATLDAQRDAFLAMLKSVRAS